MRPTTEKLKCFIFSIGCIFKEKNSSSSLTQVLKLLEILYINKRLPSKYNFKIRFQDIQLDCYLYKIESLTDKIIDKCIFF